MGQRRPAAASPVPADWLWPATGRHGADRRPAAGRLGLPVHQRRGRLGDPGRAGHAVWLLRLRRAAATRVLSREPRAVGDPGRPGASRRRWRDSRRGLADRFPPTRTRARGGSGNAGGQRGRGRRSGHRSRCLRVRDRPGDGPERPAAHPATSPGAADLHVVDLAGSRPSRTFAGVIAASANAVASDAGPVTRVSRVGLWTWQRVGARS